MNPWVLLLPATQLRAAARLRCWPGIAVCPDADRLWLRLAPGDDRLDQDLRRLPGAQRFTESPPGFATPVGSFLPSHRLPEHGWVALASWARPVLPTPALPGRTPTRALIAVQPSAEEQPCTVLLSTWCAWTAWVDQAPAHRLAPLRFALSDGGQVLVCGDPLPPIPGDRFYRSGRVAVPAGHRIAWGLDAAAIAALSPAADALIVFTGGDRWQRVPEASLVRATRSGVRLCGRAGHV